MSIIYVESTYFSIRAINTVAVIIMINEKGINKTLKYFTCSIKMPPINTMATNVVITINSFFNACILFFKMVIPSALVLTLFINEIAKYMIIAKPSKSETI